MEWSPMERMLPPMRETRLGNGVRVVTVHCASRRARHMVAVGAGAVDDPPGLDGLAHYVEHLMFRGSPGLEDGAYDRLVRELGGRFNAFTTEDQTVYYADLPLSALPRIVEIETARLRGLAAPDAEALVERDVVMEERHQRIDGDPEAVLHERMQLALFAGHPRGHLTIGSPETIARFDGGKARAFHAEHYVPGNVAVVVSGAVDHEEVVELASRTYGTLPAGGREGPRPVPAARPPERITLRGRAKGEERTVTVCFPTPPADPCVEVLAVVLGDDTFGPLWRDLVERRRVAVSVHAAAAIPARGSGELWITLVPATGVDGEDALAALDEALARIANGGLDRETVDLVRRRMLVDLSHSLDDHRNVATPLARYVALGGTAEGYRGCIADMYTAPHARIVDLAARVLRQPRVAGILEGGEVGA